MFKISTLELVAKVENSPPHKHTHKHKRESSRSQCVSLCGARRTEMEVVFGRRGGSF